MSPISRRVVPGIIAAAVLGLVLFETSDALRSQLTGPVSKPRSAASRLDPYAHLDGLIAAGARDVLPSTMRDPFGYGSVSQPTVGPRPVIKPKPPVVVERPMPVLTAVVSDADPQAVIRFEGRSYTVRAGSLFADFRVVSISADQVVLDKNGEQIVLHRVTKGE
jgi:hypothetical protein